jgi:AcrR family transcriptional regulator
MAQRRGDTRDKIQKVALELFAEQGYDKTSLREIAERLGVTKAALYYHFKTKEEIVTSLLDDFRAQVDEIIEWAQAQEMDDEIRREVLRRYAAVLAGPGDQVMQFVQGNQSTMRELRDSKQMFDRFTALTRVLTRNTTSLTSELRAAIALFSVHVGHGGPFALTGTPDERRAAALEIAFELVSGQPNLSSTSSGVSPKSASS